MRRQLQVPVRHTLHSPLQLHHILCVAAILLTAVQAESKNKLYLVCQQSDTLKYSAVPINPNDDYNLHPKSDSSQDCGISDLKSVEPLLRFVKVKTYHDDTPKEVYYKESDVTVIDGTAGPSGDVRWRGPAARARRQVEFGKRGIFRGQAQSTYLAIDRGSGKDDGKAEVHLDADSSRASVSASGGMGQAQKQSVYDPSRSKLGSKSLRTPTQGVTGTQFGRGSHESNQGGSGMGYGQHQGGSGVLTPGLGRQGGNGNDPNGSGIPGSGTNRGLDGRGSNMYGLQGQDNGDE